MHLLPVSSGKTVENPDETLGQVSGEGFLSRFSHPSLSGICAVALLLCTSLPAARGVAKHNKKSRQACLTRFSLCLRRERFRQKTPLSGLYWRFSELRSQLTYCRFRHHDYSSSHRLLLPFCFPDSHPLKTQGSNP